MDNSNIRYIDEIPPTYRSVFQEYPCFNTVQSSVLNDALQTDNSLVVSAPTGSGKTAIFEMAIVRILMLNETTGSIPNIKIIYVSPIKALCRERLIDWHKKFSAFGLKCISLTSDTDDVDARNISYYNLIITTPEKWDVVTRRWRDNQKFMAAINLFMIDEVHLLNADTRGSTLEVIVSRMKTAEGVLMLNHQQIKIRFIALSATIPNVEDIAEWIGPSRSAKYFKFSEDVRPVKLDKIVCGFGNNAKSTFKFELSLNYKLPNLINRYSKGKPTLIFCSTRKSVEMTTSHLVANLQIRLTQEQKNQLNEISKKITDAKLRQFILHGLALHHAGLVPENRNLIEASFREGHLPILVTTSTLAMGVNLPAHLVIVKGTKRYDSSEGFKDYDEVSIFQMIGRAGRSQFDSSATALILTSIEDKLKYEQMLNCTQKIESNLHKHLTEHLNAEIVLKTITDLEVAMNWLSSTFLYVRAKKCPEKYKLPVGLSKEKIDKKLLEICQIDLNKLVRAGMIKMNQEIEVAPTVVGEIMAKYYIDFNTMELFTKVSGNEIMIQILALFSKCQEFSEIYLRSNDKKCLNLLNKNSYKESIRFPLTGKIKTKDMKINCIIQAVLGNLDIPDQSILNDSVRVMRSCERLACCFIEYLETRSKCYTALLNTTILAKCFHVKLWENSAYVSKQLTGVGQVISTLLVKAGKTSIKELINTNPRHIEMIVGRKAPFGSTIIEEASHLPEYKMTLEKCNSKINLVINLLNPSDVEEMSKINLSSKMTLLVGDNDNNRLLYEKYAHSYMLDNPKVTRSINIKNKNPAFITADLISDDWVGIDCKSKLELSFNPTDATNESPKTKHNSKQTYMEMYMHQVKKDLTRKKNSDANSISKKNSSACAEVQSDKVVQPINMTSSKGKQSKILNKNNDMSMICESENSLHKKNKEGDASQSINYNYLELEETELKPTSEAEQDSSNKKASSKKRKILVSNSIFRTKDKYPNSINLEKSRDIESKGNKSSYKTSLRDDGMPKKINLLQLQNNENKDKFKCNKMPNIEHQDLIFINDNNQMNTTRFGDGAISRYEKKNSSKTLKLKTKNASNIERHSPEEFFPSDSQMIAVMDAFERNTNTLANDESGRPSKEESESSDNTNMFVDKINVTYNSNINKLGPSIYNENRSTSRICEEYADRQCSPSRDAPQDQFYFENPTNSIIDRGNMEQRELKKTQNHTIVKNKSQNLISDNDNIQILTGFKDGVSHKVCPGPVKQNSSQKRKSTTTKANDADRTSSEEYFPYESQMHAVMDALEKNIHIMEDNKSGSNKGNSDETNMCDDLGVFIENKRGASRLFDKYVKRQNGPLCDDYGNKNFSGMEVPQKQFHYQINSIVSGTHGELRGCKQVKNVPNTSLFDYTNSSTKQNRECDNIRKMGKYYAQSKNPCTKNDTVSTEYHHEKYNKNLTTENEPFEKEESRLVPGKSSVSSVYADLHNEYNLKMQSNKENEDQKYKEKNNVEENRDKEIKDAMNYSLDSRVQHGLYQRNFLTPGPKRQRENLDSSYEESQAKRIKWRSPLVHSPPEMFFSQTNASKPSFCLNFSDAGSSSKEDTKESSDLRFGAEDPSSSSTNLNISGNSSKHSNIASSSTLTRKKLAFPLCDQDYISQNDSFDKSISYLKEVCDLEYFGLTKKQGCPQKASAVRSPTSAGEYYNQLLSSQRTNIKSKDIQSVATYEFIPESTLNESQKLQRSSVSNAKLPDLNSTMPYSQMCHYPKLAESDVNSETITHELHTQNRNMPVYTQEEVNKFQCNNLYKNFENDINYIEKKIDTGHQEIPVQGFPTNNDSVHHGFVSSQKPNDELHRRRLGYCLDDGRYLVQPSRFFVHQQPFPDEINYRHQEILSPYPMYPPAMGYGYPLPTYVGIDPYFKGLYPGIKIDPTYPTERNNINPRITLNYQSQLGTVPEDYADQFSQHPQQRIASNCQSQVGPVSENYIHRLSQQLEAKPSHFRTNTDQGNLNFENYTRQGNLHFEYDTDQGKPANYFNSRSPYKNVDGNSHMSDAFFQAYRREQESRDRNLSQNNENTFMFGQTDSRPIMFNTSSQLDNPYGHLNSETPAQSNKGMTKHGLRRLFSQKPKRQLQPNQSLNITPSRRCSFPKNSQRPLKTPSSSQKRPLHLNLNSFEDRLDNITLPRNHDFNLSTNREQQYDPRASIGSTSNQSNDKEFFIKGFRFPSGRN